MATGEADLSGLAGQGCFTELAAAAQDMELQAGLAPPFVPEADVYTVLLGVAMLTDDWQEAKFVWLRTPEHMKQGSAELSALWSVLKSVAAQQPALQHLDKVTWSPTVTPVIQALKAKMMAQSFDLLAASYSCVKIDHAAGLVGIDADDLVQVAVHERGWHYDADTKTLLLENSSYGAQHAGMIPQEQLTHLVALVAQLEHV
eukprot:m.485059 g.485059  ORF g.485059 m.485059 type:complete len:202 (-) comp23645_c0_seq1:74-679(-)